MTSNPVWHPFTIQKNAPEPIKIIKGDGILLHTSDGRVLMDLISSWWVNTVGHGNQRMAEALKKQALQLEHVIFAGYTHDPAQQLSKEVLRLLPSHFEKVFFSDNGSTAVEVAIKQAIQYWSNNGQKRTRIIAFEGSYHGDTFGAMSAAERSAFTRPFDSLLFEVHHIPFPSSWDGDMEQLAKEEQSLEALKSVIEQGADDIAALIIEPLVQGAGGMRMCSSRFLQNVEVLCTSYGILQIYDEVMTGFGRTGSWFACSKAETHPDIICLSKALTGGYLPMSLTVSSGTVYETFHSDEVHKTFWHGHSYTANPLGCAAALEAISIMKELEPAFTGMEQIHRKFFDLYMMDLPLVKPRFCGTIMAFDLADTEKQGYFSEWGPKIKKMAPEYGLLIRPLGNTVYFLPPYVISTDELELAYKTLAALIKQLA